MKLSELRMLNEPDFVKEIADNKKVVILFHNNFYDRNLYRNNIINGGIRYIFVLLITKHR